MSKATRRQGGKIPSRFSFIIHPSPVIIFAMLGSTLSNDPLADKRFDFPFAYPPYGHEWSMDSDEDTAWETLPSRLPASQ